jgi:FAD/FMN-containing dehydrogenase
MTARVLVGAVLTLLLGTALFVGLQSVHQGDWFWPIVGGAELLCACVGGYVAVRSDQPNRRQAGALSGMIAGLVVVVAAASISRLAPRTTLVGVVVLAVWGAG